MTAFGDVLGSGTGGLDHLIGGATVLFNIKSTEPYSDIIDQLGNLKAFQFAVTTVGWDQLFRFRTHGHMASLSMVPTLDNLQFWETQVSDVGS